MAFLFNGHAVQPTGGGCPSMRGIDSSMHAQLGA
jgi:hypothetical protein